ncbi:MAG: HepT-like ribonuclease domain-containing protein [Chitinophagales bacterium]
MRKLLKINPAIPLTHSRVIVDLRNRVIHTYDSIDETIIWKIVVKDIPLMLEEVDQLLLQ